MTAERRRSEIRVNGRLYRLNARPDVGDVRDFLYTPTLGALSRTLDARERGDWWWSHKRVRDQGPESNCTAQALAGIVDHLRARDLASSEDQAPLNTQLQRRWASADMLYAVARYHDEWPGEDYNGSSIRGALKGFYYNGVCSEKAAESSDPDNWHMTREILGSAMTVQLGAYFRVRPRLADVHSALNETGLVLASADIHKGWAKPDADGMILFSDSPKLSRHAFIIIGYDEEAFLIQNSWGRKWGGKGVARWRYEDWAANVIDQWVLRLAAPTTSKERNPRRPQVASNRMSSLIGRSGFETGEIARDPAPSRLDVLGHVIPLTRGRLAQQGHYHTNAKTMKETASIIRGGNYDHVLLHFMGLLENEARSVAAIRDTIPVYRENRIYPIYVMLENDLSAELHRNFERAVAEANEQVGMMETPEKNRLVEGRLSLAAQRMLEVVISSGIKTIRLNDPEDGICGTVPGEGLNLLHEMFEIEAELHQAGKLSYHFSAHGFGAEILAAILEDHSTDTLAQRPVVSTVSLISPMITRSRFRNAILPSVRHKLEGRRKRDSECDVLEVENLFIFALDEDAENDDRPIPGYNGSWPQLWSYVGAINAMQPNGDTELATHVDPHSHEKRKHLPYLALSHHAQGVEETEAKDRCINVSMLGADTEGLIRPKHRDLDLRLYVLDELLRRILGHDPDVSFKNYYSYRDSFLS